MSHLERLVDVQENLLEYKKDKVSTKGAAKPKEYLGYIVSQTSVLGQRQRERFKLEATRKNVPAG
jgi:hypothetical protein